jgi:hypothetical protein
LGFVSCVATPQQDSLTPCLTYCLALGKSLGTIQIEPKRPHNLYG